MARFALIMFSCLFAFFGLTTQAQSLPSKEEATSLLHRAFQEITLQDAGTPPYHLVARVHIEMEEAFRDGMYEVLWASPNRFRENFKIEGLAETDVVLGDKLHIFRTSPLVMFPFDAVRQFLSSPIPTRLTTRPEAKRISFDEIHGERDTCIYTHEDVYVSASVERVCFSTSTNEVVLIEAIPRDSSDSFLLRLEDFAGVGTKRYPRHLHQEKFGEVLDVKVDAINEAKFGDSVFVPPPGSELRDWCPVPILQKTAKQVISFRFPKASRFPAYYILIGVDGRAKNAQLLWEPDKKLKQQFNLWLQETKFPIRMCGDRAVEYDTVVSSNGASPMFVSGPSAASK
jgi:hypothetical protein